MDRQSVLGKFSLGLIFGAVLYSEMSSAITLDEYLSQVKSDSYSVKATEAQAEGASLKARESDAVFTPKLFANARVGYDGKESTTSGLTYDELRMQNYSLGVSQDFSFGLQTKISYALDRTELVGSNLSSSTPKTTWYATPLVELSMPLWGNGFGRSTRANQNLLMNQNKAEEFGARTQNSVYLVEAEAAYWRLSATQEVVQVQTRALKNAQNILDYVQKKARMNLGEQADVLQAQALVEATKYQLQLAQNQEKAARRMFNTFINKSGDSEVSSLEILPFDKISATPVPEKRPGDRADYKAAVAQAEAAKSAAQLVAERNKPNVDLYGSYAINGKNNDLDKALSNVSETSRDTAFIGVRLNVPLNISATSDAKAGALKAERAAELNVQYKQFTQEQDWYNLTQQLVEAKENFRLASNIVNAQKAKLENERTRLRQGRTTTYQVLMFEQDFSNSEANRVQAASAVLGLQTQIKLYQASNQGGL